MSDQTPIETLAKEWLQRDDELSPIAPEHDYDGLHNIKMLAAFAAHVEAQRPGKVLAEAQYKILSDRMVEEHRKYGDKLRGGHWAEIAARKVVSHMADFAPVRPTLSVDKIMEVVKWGNQNFGNSGAEAFYWAIRERLNKLIG